MNGPVNRVAVAIVDATKSYDGKHVVLNGLNMTVPKGKIYGLLGPSGCGKTTLLRTIVGESELDSGELTIDTSKREDIGYMPQDINLHMTLTILQTYKFYGRILNIDEDKIVKRAKQLQTILDLPPDDCMIQTLSGGQQRRVSMGVALLHDPNILILDEPTVGLDPILSNSIWNYLVSLAEKGKTIIITTHYIEEARQAHIIGLMRYGILVAEESPEMLMTRCNTDTLEEAFLALSRKQEMESQNQIHSCEISKTSFSKKSKMKINFNDGFYRKTRMYSLLYKNKCLFFQQKSFSIFLILLPLVTTYFTNQTIGHNPKGLNIAVVNKEMQHRHSGICRPEYYKGCILDNPQDRIMSCAYVERIESKSLNIIYYDEVETALNAVKKNYVWGLMYFQNNYTTSMVVRFNNNFNTSTADIELSTVQIWIDYSNHIIGNLLKSNVYIGMQEYLSNELTKCNMSSKIGTTPILFEKSIYGSESSQYIHYSSAAILCLVCYFLPILFSTSLILMEKNEGMMERMMVHGIQFSEVFVSMCIIQMVVHTVQTAVSMYVNYIYFDNPYLGDHLPTIAMLLLIGMEGMIMGVLFGAVCKTFMIAGYVCVGLNFCYCYTCGLISPVESAHFLLKFISPLLPMNAPIKAVQAMTNRGMSIDSEPVYLGFLSILCWSIIKVIAIFIIGKFKKDLWVSRK